MIGKKMKLKFWAIALSTTLLTLAETKPVLAASLLTGNSWLRHVKRDLNPWWNQKSAYGDPIGAYPSYRCDDGGLVNPEALCHPYQFPQATKQIDNHHIVSQSRQIYTYGSAFHLTGNPRYLSLAKAGVDWLLENGIDRKNGGTYKFIDGDRSRIVTGSNRTAQEQAYGLQGLTFYYYLTGDNRIFSTIRKLHEHNVDNYYDFPNQEIKFFLPDSGRKATKKIQAPLDQTNAYLLLLAKTAPRRYRQEYIDQLEDIADILIDEFYSPRYNIFWNTIDTPQQKKLTPGNANYGNSIKSMWMIYLIGKLAENEDLLTFATDNIPPLLEQAYDDSTGSWTYGPYLDENGNIVNNLNKDWWMYAVLNQTAGTLSLEDPELVNQYLQNTFDWWIENMVDEKNKGVWNTLTYPDLEPVKQKQYPWKNGYHTYEHALVGYITTQAVNNRSVKLYFAHDWRKKLRESRFQAYYFGGEVEKMRVTSMGRFRRKGFPRVNDYQKVTTFFEIPANQEKYSPNLELFAEELVVAHSETVPEPMTILGTGFVAGFLFLCKKKK